MVNEVEELEAERDAMEAVAGRLQGLRPEEPPDAAAWRGSTRSDAVLRILRENAVAMTNAELLAELRAKGRTKDTPNYLAATLQHLKRYEEVVSPSRGLWVAAEVEVNSP